MGIVNCTPDSFSDGGQFYSSQQAVEQAKHLVSQGAHIIDIGGESSRPGSEPVLEVEELQRIIPVITKLKAQLAPDIKISVDTTKPTVAQAVLELGVDIINDINGFRNPNMVEVVSRFNCQIVVMHMQGEPKNMQKNPIYGDVVTDIKLFFQQQIKTLKAAGIEDIILDPGIGFGKTNTHNWEILRRLSEFRDLDCPILLGISRKSFLAEITGITDPGARDEATRAIHTLTQNYADIWRVHNVVFHA